MTGRKALESGLRVQFQDWLDGLDDDQIAALTGHWENIMDDAALFRADSWVIAEKALARLRGNPAGPGRDVRHDPEQEAEDMGIRDRTPRRDPAEAEDGPQVRNRRQRLQMRANARANREDDQRPTEEIPPGQLQSEGVWQPRTRRP